MRLPHRLQPLPPPWGEKRENKASFITLPSLPLQSLTPLEHYPFPVLFWCVNECIENLQAPKEMLSMKMRQSESTRVHTARHSSQPDSNQTPSPPLLSCLKTHKCPGTCWLISLCRQKTFTRWPVRWIRGENALASVRMCKVIFFLCWRDDTVSEVAEEIKTLKFFCRVDHGREVKVHGKMKSLFWSSEVQSLWYSKAQQRKCLKVFIRARPNEQQHLCSTSI